MSKWEKVKLGDVVEFHNHKRVPLSSLQRETRKGKYPYYGASGIIDYLDGYIFDGKYLLISEDGENLRSRKTEIAFFAKGKFWVNNHAHIVTAKENLDIDFLCYYIKILNISLYITGAAQPKLNKANLENIEFPLPPLEEQKRITAILSSLDDKIEVNNQINKNLEEQAQAIFKSWFVDKNQDDYATLSDYIVLNPKITLKKETIASAIDMKDLSTINMSVNVMAEKKAYKGGAKFQNNHTLLARITPCLENGKTAFVDFLDEGEIGFGSTEFIVMQPKEHVGPYYVYCLARNDDFRNYAIKSMVGSSGRQRVQVDVLENYPISKVSEDVFLKFTQYVEPMFKEIRKNTLESQCLAKIRNTLLPKLMNSAI